MLRNAGGAGQQLRTAGTAFTGLHSPALRLMVTTRASDVIVAVHRVRRERRQADRDVARPALLERRIAHPLAAAYTRASYARADREPVDGRGGRHQAEADRGIHRRRQHRRGAPERGSHDLAGRLGRARPAARVRRMDARARRRASGRHEGGALDVLASQAVLVRAGEWVRYSSPEEGGASYIAVCLPAFTPATVHRDDD